MLAHVVKTRPSRSRLFLSLLSRTHGRRAGISTPGMPLCAHIWPAGGVSLARERAGKKPIGDARRRPPIYAQAQSAGAEEEH
jgi:hypothetical protein